MANVNPLSPPCIPPNPGFRDLPAKSKFLAVGKSGCERKKNGSGGEKKLPEETCHPHNNRDPLACRKSPESGVGSGDSESDEFLISGGDREGRSHRDKARAIPLVGTGNFDKMGGAIPPSHEIIADLGEVGKISGGISSGVG